MAGNRKRTPRLGRGLSSLMAQPARVGVKASEKSAEKKVSTTQSAGEQGAMTPQAVGDDVGLEQMATPLAKSSDAVGADGLRQLTVEAIKPNRYQPRQAMDETALNQLAASIRADGLMQPIVVRPAGEAGKFELIAGERRWRAAQLADVETVPAIVRDIDDQQAAEWALIENLQREDLNAIDRAEAFQRLADQFGLSHQQIADRVGLERSTVANLIRLLDLCNEVRQLVRDGLLSMGQARAIAGLLDVPAQQAIAQRAVKQGLSVRQVEAAVRELGRSSGAGASTGAKQGGKSAYLADLERQIAEQLQTRVTIRPGRKKGAGMMTVEFYSLDQFDALLSRFGVKTD